MEMIAVVHRASIVHSDKIGLGVATTQSWFKDGTLDLTRGHCWQHRYVAGHLHAAQVLTTYVF